MNFFNFITTSRSRVLREDSRALSCPIYGEMRLLSSEFAARTRENSPLSAAKLRRFKAQVEVKGEGGETGTTTGKERRRGRREGQKFDSNSKMPRTLNRDSASYRRERAEYFNTPDSRRSRREGSGGGIAIFGGDDLNLSRARQAEFHR